MGFDGKIHGARGNSKEWGWINLPKGYNTTNDLINGAKLTLLLIQNK
jgi:hypothetical protein